MSYDEKYRDTYHKLIRKLVNSQKLEALRILLKDMGTVDIAFSLLQLKLKHQMIVFELLETARASKVLNYLHQHSPVVEEIVEQMNLQRLGTLIEEMDRDDAADLISVLDEEKASEVMATLPAAYRQEMISLLQYDEKSAGGIMDPYVVSVRKELTVKEAARSIRIYSEEKDLKSFYNIYVIDEYHHLIGFISLSQLFLADEKHFIKDLMDPKVISVHVDQDQEQVARIAQDYNLVTVPVVDKYLRLIGRITSDDLMDVMHERYVDDIGQMAGTGDEEVLEPSVFRASKDRLPWLLLGLGGSYLAAIVISGYSSAISKLPQAAYFIPLIAALGGNVGIQSSSLIVRGLATGELRPVDLIQRSWRELRVGFLNGFGCSLIIFLMAWSLTDRMAMGITTGVALFLVVCLATLVGTAVPMILKHFNMDPALSTGPFITTANDILGITIYLSITFSVQARL
ncbi:magnesium transporter [Deltaproteobacteria bacterium TL4]